MRRGIFGAVLLTLICTWLIAQGYAKSDTAEAMVADPVLVGAGDIASCSSPGDQATATLLDVITGTVVAIGDEAYPYGSLTDFMNCYDPTWGRHKARTKPVPGNHEYLTPNAAGYFTYFGAAAGDPTKGYYSYDVGTWHVIALNSEVAHNGGSPQEVWLRADLNAHQSICALAYWHRPRFSSGPHGDDVSFSPFWQDLYNASAAVVLNGHDHDYERFAPQNPSGAADPSHGIREFVVGTGGASLYLFGVIQPNSEVRGDSAFGVLKLRLHATGYDWQFVPEAGKTFTDSGSGMCHGSPRVPALFLYMPQILR